MFNNTISKCIIQVKRECHFFGALMLFAKIYADQSVDTAATDGKKILVNEKFLNSLSAQAYKKRLEDANMASKLVGNTYTASVFLGLASLIDRAGGRGDLTPGKSISVFSYGSGALATMYRLSV